MAVLYLYHSVTYDLVVDEDPEFTRTKEGQVLHEGLVYTSLGTRKVNSADDGDRHKIAKPTPGGGTLVTVSPSFKGTPTEFMHLAEALLDRHAPGEKVAGVYSPDAPDLAKRLAALMGVEHFLVEPDQPAPGGATLPEV